MIMKRMKRFIKYVAAANEHKTRYAVDVRVPAWQRWNRVSGSRVTGSAILAGSGRVTGQGVRPGVGPGFEF